MPRRHHVPEIVGKKYFKEKNVEFFSNGLELAKC